MSLKLIKDFSDDDITVEVEDAIVIFKLKNNIFNLMTDSDKAERYIELMSVIEQSPEIKVVLSLFDPDALGGIAYAQYISSLCGENIKLKDLDQKLGRKRPSLTKMRLV